MTNILSLNYWFVLNPGPWNSIGKYLLIVLVMLFVIGLVLRFIAVAPKFKGVRSGFFKKLSSWFFTWSILGVVFWWFRSQQVPFFSARFWLLTMMVIGLVWIVFIVLSLRKRLQRERDLLKKSREFDKYLPI